MGMLILTRRNGESILIGADIKVTVLQGKRGHISIGITAPPNLEIDREEVRQRKERERAAAK